MAPVLQNLPDHLEQGSGRGNQRSLSSPVLHLSIEPLFEDGAALAYGGPGGLHQGCKQPLVGALDGSALLLARRPIVAGAHARPTGQVLGAGKLRHVASSFCQNHGSGFGGDAGDRLQQLVLALEGLEFQQSPLAEFGELVF
jgi:hypothetical protein